MKDRILVLGGTGLLGKPVVRHLQNEGLRVRLLVRNPEKAESIFAPPVEIAKGDATDPNSLKKAMEECSGVHISIGGTAEQTCAEIVSGLGRSIHIERISYISGATVCRENAWFPMVAAKLKAEEAIKKSGTTFTIFCPTWPMEMLARFARNGKPFMIGEQPKPVHFFAVDELGRMVAMAFRKEGAANKRFYIYGPEAITLRQGLERYCQNVHPGGKAVSVMPVWLAKSLGTITRNKALRFAAELMAYFDKTGETGNPEEADRTLGKPAITLDEWIKQKNN